MAKINKAFYAFIVTMLTVLLVCGCAKREEPKQVDEQIEEEPVEIEEHYDVDSIAMSNYGCSAFYFMDDGWIYGQGEGANYDPAFVKMRPNGTEQKYISYEKWPSFICKSGEYIYLLLADANNQNDDRLYRCRLSGDDLECIVDHSVDNLSIVDNKIYYQKSNAKNDFDDYKTYGFYSCNLDGSDEIKILGKKKKIDMPYIVGSYLFYLADDKEHALHKYNLETKEDTVVSQKYVYSYVIHDDYLYYIALSKLKEKYEKVNEYGDITPNEDGKIYRHSLKDDSEEILYEGASSTNVLFSKNKLFFVNTNDSCRLYSISLKDNSINAITEDAYIQPLAISKSRVIYYALNSDFSELQYIYSSKLNGSDKIALVG